MAFIEVIIQEVQVSQWTKERQSQQDPTASDPPSSQALGPGLAVDFSGQKGKKTSQLWLKTFPLLQFPFQT